MAKSLKHSNFALRFEFQSQVLKRYFEKCSPRRKGFRGGRTFGKYLVFREKKEISAKRREWKRVGMRWSGEKTDSLRWQLGARWPDRAVKMYCRKKMIVKIKFYLISLSAFKTWNHTGSIDFNWDDVKILHHEKSKKRENSWKRSL